MRIYLLWITQVLLNYYALATSFNPIYADININVLSEDSKTKL